MPLARALGRGGRTGLAAGFSGVGMNWQRAFAARPRSRGRGDARRLPERVRRARDPHRAGRVALVGRQPREQLQDAGHPQALAGAGGQLQALGQVAAGDGQEVRNGAGGHGAQPFPGLAGR
ncbi:hypothetical protein ACSNOI_45060, partial [Actinomadura kijaniata]|uniref:hypothetical protein n=1 Tax=Actinomadura kijaniata TaxID=46161 RepID=UPI003F1CB5A5